MKRSTERILTTHVGSLIRPPELLPFIRAKQGGQPYDRQEPFRHAGRLHRRLEVVDVPPDLGEPGVLDGSDAGGDAGARADRRRRALRGVELPVELREAGAVRAARKTVLAGRCRAPLESAEALQRVLRPADGFAELAVAHHVDARCSLFLNNCFY